MADTAEEMGPIDWVLVEFDGPFTGEALPHLIDLVDRGIIRLLDLVVIRKDVDGSFVGLEISDLDLDEQPHLAVFEGVSSGLLGDDDVKAAGEALGPDTRAVMLVYENSWAAPFATAVRRSGGHLVDSGRISVEDIVAALDELDAAG